MEKELNLAHWEDWANNYGTSFRATTKCLTIKKLEIDSLARAITKYSKAQAPLVLEIGCGNGFNGFGLVERLNSVKYVGLDFSPKMILNAKKILHEQSIRPDFPSERIGFGVADARGLRVPLNLFETSENYLGRELKLLNPIQQVDVIFTNRMLINLASPEEQLHVMESIAKCLKPGGFFLMLENYTKSHALLNEIRISLGLKPREPAHYNIFISDKVIDDFKNEMDLLERKSISGLHDLILYAVAPAASNGEIEYDSSLMNRLTDSILTSRQMGLDDSEECGQNVLWVWTKRS